MNLGLLSTFTPPNSPNSSVTNTITFSFDSLLAIIETDHFNPVIVLNLTDSNFTIAYSIVINDVIIEAHFLDSSNTVLILFCLNSVTYVDLITNEQFITAKIIATVYDADH